MKLYDTNYNNSFTIRDSNTANRYEESFVFMNEGEYEFFEERAAIMEFEGQLKRENAEQLAYQKILKNRKIYAQAC
jgi:hypothetical protein